MHIVLTGSLGNIGRPLAKELVTKGHSVVVISTNPRRKEAIEALGAKASIGTMEDVSYLTDIFKGADAVYCMESFGFFDPDFDYLQYIYQIAHNYKQAIVAAGVKKVIHLSSVGAHTSENVGILKFHNIAEKILGELTEDVVIKSIRPVGFYVNLFAHIPTIKSEGAIVTNFGSQMKEPWVSPYDIATVIANEFESPFDQRSVRYVASDEVSANEIAVTLGRAIGKPDLKWVTVTDEQYLEGLLTFGMNRQIAQDYVAMQAAQRTGSIYEDFNKHRPVFGKVKLSDFANEFAAIYNKQ